MGRRYSILAGVLVAMIMMAAASAGAAEPLKIRIGWSVVPTELAPILFVNKDVIRHYGKTYTVEPVHFAGSPPMLTALAAGDLDIVPFSFPTFGVAIENAHMDDLRIIADGFQDGVAGHYSVEYMVLKDGPIKTIEDLKGKVVASNAIGGAVDLGIRAMLRRHHLEDRRDYTAIEAPFPTLSAMLDSHKVALIGTLVPFSNALKASGNTRVLFTLRDAIGPSQLLVYAGRRSYVEAHRAAIEDFLEDWLRSLHWYLDPAHRAAAIRIIAEFAKQPASLFADYALTDKDFYRDPEGLPNVAAYQSNLQTQKALGFLRSDITIAKYVDLSFLHAAETRIK